MRVVDLFSGAGGSSTGLVDARAEGVDAISCADVPRNGTLCRRDDFAQLWQKINGKRAPWASNPWVWRISFRRLP